MKKIETEIICIQHRRHYRIQAHPSFTERCNVSIENILATASLPALRGWLILEVCNLTRDERVRLLLSECVFSDRLEGLFDVDGLLGAGLEVGDVALGSAPCERSLLLHPAVIQINLVANDDKGEVIRIRGAGLDQELVPPGVQVLERLCRRHIEHKDARISATVERHT